MIVASITRMQNHWPVVMPVSLLLVFLMIAPLSAQVIRQPDAAARVIDAHVILSKAPDHFVGKDIQTTTPWAEALYMQPGGFAVLRSGSSLLLKSFPLPDGSVVDLRVESFSVFTEKSVLVEMTPAGEVRRPLPDITFYRGYVQGEIGSWVFLSVQRNALGGTITRSDGTGFSIITAEQQSFQASAPVLNVFEIVPEMTHYGCGVTEDEEWNAVVRRGFSEAPRQTAAVDTLFAGIAIDADYESFQHYGGTDKTAEYITARMAESTAIYERDLTIRLHIPFMRVWGVTDPFQGSSDSQLLNVFGTYWEANMDSVKRTLATMISRKPISGNGVSQGLAWVDVLCSSKRGYNFVKFSGNNSFTTGHTMVLAHEIGHNFGSMHTHSCTWNPPIDSCYTAEPVRNQGPCFSRSDIHLILGGGELMSYCHLSFGNKNTNLVFRDRTGPLVRSRAEAATCMDARSSVYSIGLTYPTGGESVCAGNTMTLTWQGSGLKAVSIYLSKNSGSTFDSLLVSGLSRQVKSWDWNVPNNFTPGTTFRFKIKDEANDTLISMMTQDFEIRQGTFIVTQVTWRNVCVGEGANFNVTASGAGTLRYQWKKKGADIPGETSPTLQLQNMQSSDDSTTFTCVVTGDCGSVESKPALLKVFSVPRILRHPANDTLCVGGTATFTVTADGPELHYKWFTQGKIFNVDSPTFEIANITPADANTCYYCEVSSPCGRISTQSGCIVIPNAANDKFTTPAPFQQLTAGGMFDVVWTMYCIPTMKLEYTLDGGQSWTTINANIPGDTPHLLWDVPTTETNNGTFRVSDANNPSRSKLSPIFSIKKKPLLSFSDDAINFGRLPVGALTTKSISFVNSGLGDLQITKTTLVGNSTSSVKNGAPFTVTPGTSHDVTVETTPSLPGPLEGFMLVEHNAAGSPDTLALIGDAFVVVSAGQVPSPTVLSLSQNYPNPVSLSVGAMTRISYDLPTSQHVKVTVFNLLGTEVATIVNAFRNPGRYDVHLDMSRFPAGMYFFQLTASGTSITRVMHLMK